MPVTVTTVGPFYSVEGSEITFSSLRENFKEVGIGSVNASSLLRDAKPTSKNPIVPDSTENVGISSTLNWKISQFRPAIKYYNITHTGTETNYDLTASLTWNSNLNKTIVKNVNLDGTYGSINVDNPSVIFEAEIRNVNLYVNGEILGAGGKGGTASNTKLKGGDALSIKSDGNEVNVIPKGPIYGGGGGGAKGATGLQGSSGSCSYYTYYTAPSSCGPLPSCGSDFLESSSSTGSCNCSTFCVEVWFNPPSPPSPPRPPYYPPPSCPDPDTLILMADGTKKKARDVKVGDILKTQHETTLEWGEYPVLSISIANEDRIKLVFENDFIICSLSHKMYVEGKGWVSARNMVSGDIVSGQKLLHTIPDKYGEVVAITVESAHAYIANNLLSHNLVGKGGGCPDPEMPILMADRTEKRAGDIQVGDEVLTQHEKTLEWGVHKVIQKNLLTENKYAMKFGSIKDSNLPYKEIICSDSHRFYVDGKEWISVNQMELGDVVSDYELVSSEEISEGTVVQIAVDEAHTYICAGLLSHNKLIASYSPYYPPPYYAPPYYAPNPPRPPRGGGGGGGKKSDIRLKIHIRDLKTLFEI